MAPNRGEVEPQMLGAHPGLIHDLQRPSLPVAERCRVQRRRIAGEDDRAGQAFDQHQQVAVFLLGIVVAVAPPRGAGVRQVGRIAGLRRGAMIERRVPWTRSARRDLDAIVAYIATDSIENGYQRRQAAPEPRPRSPLGSPACRSANPRHFGPRNGLCRPSLPRRPAAIHWPHSAPTDPVGTSILGPRQAGRRAQGAAGYLSPRSGVTRD